MASIVVHFKFVTIDLLTDLFAFGEFVGELNYKRFSKRSRWTLNSSILHKKDSSSHLRIGSVDFTDSLVN